MAFTIRERTETTLSEINVTPLVDVMLVLLIIFMVTAPMLSSSVDVALQQTAVMPKPQSKEHLVVSITADRRIFVADALTDMTILPVRVRETIERTGVRTVAIRGDKSVDYGFVLQVLDKLRVAQVEDVGLVMAPPDERPGARR